MLERTAKSFLKAGAVDIDLIDLEGRLSFRAKPTALAGRNDVGGFPVAGPINSVISEGTISSLRLGPDEWLLLAPADDVTKIEGEIARSMDGAFFSLVDISHRNVAFSVEGAAAASVINVGCPIDLDESAFPVGMATQTLLGKAEIILVRLEKNAWRVECWRSFESYVHAYLTNAAKDFSATR